MNTPKTNNPRRRLLRFGSLMGDILLNPLFLTTYALAYESFALIPGDHMITPKLIFILGCALLTIVGPMLVGLSMRRFHAISSFWHIYNQKDRRLLLIVYLIFYTFALTISNSFHLPYFIKAVPMSAIIVMFIILIINIFTNKIDSHFVAAATLCTNLFLMGVVLHTNVLFVLSCAILLVAIKAYIQLERHLITGPALFHSLMVGIVGTFINLWIINL